MRSWTAIFDGGRIRAERVPRFETFSPNIRSVGGFLAVGIAIAYKDSTI